ncbi:MAG: hypothetical protein KAJ39_01315 [Gammaproteobacteria bacterium]|nr:hypothetical protein [Gammaproteobacteria bacterium]
MATKKVNLQYLLDNDKWQLKVTPEQSEMVQLALFGIGVFWNNSNPSKAIHTDSKWLERSANVIYYGDGFNDKLLELEEQAPQNDFDTQQEIFRWLDDGGLIKCIDSRTEYGMRNGFVVTIYNNLRANNLFFNTPSRWKKVTNWHDKLDGTVTNGRLCNIEINNNTDSTNTTRLIIDMSSDDSLFYSDEGIAYDNATPLTNAEIKAFMVDGD